MVFPSIYWPHQLKLLTTVLDDHRMHGITSQMEREHAALQLIDLFGFGIVAARALRAGLEKRHPRHAQRTLKGRLERGNPPAGASGRAA